MGEQLVLIEQDGPTTQKEAFIHYVEGMELDMIDAFSSATNRAFVSGTNGKIDDI